MSTIADSQIQNYYNDRNLRILIRDYVNGNPRLNKAIDSVVNCGQESFSKILDIGCGIGYSSWLLKAAFPFSAILGIDISDLSIQTARKLFQAQNLRFSCIDFQSEDCDGPYDLIVMIDVYEHFPRQQRSGLHGKLAELLTDDGWLIVTTPTVEHQSFLRNAQPEQLQIIDEDVTEKDLLLLAEHTQTTVVRYEKVSIWHTYDYQHFVARRDPVFKELPRPPRQELIQRLVSKIKRTFEFDNKQKRCRHIQQALKIDPVALIEKGSIIRLG